jgi:hypothetical protein
MIILHVQFHETTAVLRAGNPLLPQQRENFVWWCERTPRTTSCALRATQECVASFYHHCEPRLFRLEMNVSDEEIRSERKSIPIARNELVLILLLESMVVPILGNLMSCIFARDKVPSWWALAVVDGKLGRFGKKKKGWKEMLTCACNHIPFAFLMLRTSLLVQDQ